MRALLISNPTASAVTADRRRVVERALEATFDLEVAATEERGHAAGLAREAAEAGAKAVIAYGGDGTVNEVVNGLLAGGTSTGVALGLLPGGGTNVLARTLGYPGDLVDATGHLLELVDQGRTRRISLGRIEAHGPEGPLERVFAFGSGLALDGETVRRVEQSGHRTRVGDMAYLYHGMRSFLALRRAGGPVLELDAAGEAHDVWWAVVSNSDPLTYLGPRPMRVSPRASLEHGLDVTAARSAKFLRTMLWLAQTFTSARHVRHRDILYLHDLDGCRFRARRPVPMHADGEYLTLVERAAFRLLRDALPVYA